MAATIKIKNSSTAGAAPTSSDLVQGELAVNVTDKRLFTENSGGTVVELGTNPSSITLPDGSASAPTLLHSGDTNTGLFFPAADTIALTTGGTERLRLDSSGSLGLGVTPSAWGGSFKALQVGGATSIWSSSSGTGSSFYSNNVYFNGSARLRINAGYATEYIQDSSAGAHIWFNAASSTAGSTISFTQAMTLDASGNLLVGQTSSSGSYKLQVNGIIYAGNAFYVLSQASGGGSIYEASGNTGIAIGDTSNTLRFTTNATERARIDSSGNLLVGTTSTPTGSTGGSGFIVESVGRRTLKVATTTTGGAGLAEFINPNGVVGTISVSGSATTYGTSSDYRLKNTIAPMTGALAKVAALKPCTYKWNADGSDGEGFIAHELAEVCPHAVVGEKDAVDENGNPKYQGIDTSFLVATLTAAIQELNAKFEAYKAAHP